MKERYKVLGALVALGEFTVEDIVNRTGVKESTVNTIMARERRMLEKIADEKTGRRGGKRKRYRIKPESLEILHSELIDLYKNFPAPETLAPQKALSNERKSASVPLGLLAAEDTLLFHYRNSDDPEEKERLLRLAKLDYKKGLSESRQLLASDPSEETRLAIEGSVSRVTALRQLVDLDLLVQAPVTDVNGEVTVETLRNRLSEVGDCVGEVMNSLGPVLTSVRQFPISNRRPTESSLVPQHESYTIAKSLLDRASLETDSREKSALLEQASQALEVVWNDYESRDLPLTTIAFVRYEQGRLRFLQQDYQAARMFFVGAREVFATSEKYFDEVTKVDHYLGVLSVREFRLTQPDAPPQREIETTLAALESIDSRSQANYPLIRFLQDLLTKTISRFSVTERLLRQEIDGLKKKLQQLGTAPYEIPEQRPSLQYGAGGIVYLPVAQSSIPIAAHAHAGVGIAHEHLNLPRAMDLRDSVELGGQDALLCSRFDATKSNRKTYDLFVMMPRP